MAASPSVTTERERPEDPLGGWPDDIARLEARLKTAHGAGRVDALVELGWELRNEDTERARAYSEEALGLARGTGHPRLARCLRNLGACHNYRSGYKEALALLGEGLEAARRAGDRAAEADCRHHLGLAESGLGRFREAAGHYLAALGIQREIKDRESARYTVNNLGVVYRSLGDRGAAVRCFEEALAVVRGMGERRDPVDEAIILDNIGLLHHEAGELELALSHHRRALELLERGPGGERQIAAVLVNVSRDERGLGRLQAAVAAAERALAIAEACGHAQHQAAACAARGAALADSGQPEEAVAAFERALALARSVADRSGEACFLHELGALYLDTGELSAAAATLEAALALATAIGARGTESVAHEGLARAREAMGEFSAALAHQRAHHDLETSLRDEAAERRTAALTIQLEVETARREAEAQRSRLAELAAANEALRESEARFRALFEHSPEGVVLLDPHDRSGIWPILDCNDAYARINGYPRQELLGRSVDILDLHSALPGERERHLERLRREGRFEGEAVHRRKDGATVEVEYSTSIVTLWGRELVLGIDRDVSERRRLEAALAHQAGHDSLTGLPNRATFADRLQTALARRENRLAAVLFVDLDRFKNINDTLGHHVGDELLVAVARRLSACARAGDTLARMGGDEFTLLLPNLHGERDAERVAARLVHAMAEPFDVAGRRLFVTASVGVAVCPRDGEDAATLQRHADAAMYRAKHGGKNGFRAYAPEMEAQALERLELEGDLRLALERGELALHFQPLLELRERKVAGLEALLRWHHPRLGLLPPGRFIPLAEESELIVPVGAWVLAEACRRAAGWRGEPRVAVNVSPVQFSRPDFADTVARALAQSGLPPARLELELTESTVMRDVEESVGQLSRLRALGVRVAIDDFGTGHSSLGLLRRVRVDALKVDRSFVADLSTGGGPLVGAIVALARSLGLGVVAEGMETLEQLGALTDLGCDEAQGFLFARPVPADEVAALLEAAAGGGRFPPG